METRFFQAPNWEEGAWGSGGVSTWCWLGELPAELEEELEESCS